jgi:hypothetical protein
MLQGDIMIVKVFIFLVVLLLLFGTVNDGHVSDDCRGRSREIQQLFFAGQFEHAEPLVRSCLDKLPEDLYFLIQLDIALNGQEKYGAADRVRDQILEIWHREHEGDWKAKGSPVAEASWARLILSSREYYVVGAEYYVPEVLGSEPPQILVYYKVIALPKVEGKQPRLFKLEMSEIVTKYYVLRETFRSGGRQVVPYGDRKPDIRQVVADAIAYLDTGE